nr:DUF2784 domain-containing protein [Pseudomonas otitidis]
MHSVFRVFSIQLLSRGGVGRADGERMIERIAADAVVLVHLRCPLTDLENSLRHAAGESGYPGGFVERYILPVIYPAGLTDAIQLWLGAVVICLNLPVYGLVLWRVLRRRVAF